jgi:hypothetical protein
VVGGSGCYLFVGLVVMSWPVTNLISLEAHQAMVRARITAERERRTGIACPMCRSELKWADDVIFDSHPAQRLVKCSTSGCSFQAAIFV